MENNKIVLVERTIRDKSTGYDWQLEWDIVPIRADNYNADTVTRTHNPQTASIIIENRFSLTRLQIPVKYLLVVLPHMKFAMRDEMLRRKRARRSEWRVLN